MSADGKSVYTAGGSEMRGHQLGIFYLSNEEIAEQLVQHANSYSEKTVSSYVTQVGAMVNHSVLLQTVAENDTAEQVGRLLVDELTRDYHRHSFLQPSKFRIRHPRTTRATQRKKG